MNIKTVVLLITISICITQDLQFIEETKSEDLTLTQNGCSGWQVATMSGYDNLSGDDKNPGSLVEYTGTTVAFLNAIPVVSIHMKDWKRDSYHYINIKRKDGTVRAAQAWDGCDDNDCDDGPCCTRNAKHFGGNYLVDVERRALKNLFGISKWDQTLEKVEVQICQRFDPAPIAKKWHLKK